MADTCSANRVSEACDRSETALAETSAATCVEPAEADMLKGYGRVEHSHLVVCLLTQAAHRRNARQFKLTHEEERVTEGAGKG